MFLNKFFGSKLFSIKVLIGDWLQAEMLGLEKLICPSIRPSFCRACLSVCLSIYLSVCESDFLPVHLSVHPSTVPVCLSDCLSVHPFAVPVYLSVCPSAMPVYLSVCLSVFLSVKKLFEIIFTQINLFCRTFSGATGCRRHGHL